MSDMQGRPRVYSVAKRGKKRRRGRIMRTLRKNRKLVLLAAGVLLLIVAGIVLLCVLTAPKAEQPASAQPEAQVTETPEPSAATAEESKTPAGRFIGVIVENGAEADGHIVQKIEETALTAQSEGRIDGMRLYDAGGSSAQQVQDMRTLINEGASAVVILSRDINTYAMLSAMAYDAGLKVVAIDAPEGAEFDLNITMNLDGYGIGSAGYVSQMLARIPAGSFVQVTGSSSDAESVKAAAISGALSGSDRLTRQNAQGVEGFENYIFTAEAPQALVADTSAADVLSACIQARKVPTLITGEATAGFIKLAYEVINTGIDVEVTLAEDSEIDPYANLTEEQEPEVEIVNVKAPSMLVVAESAPYGAGSFAMECAIRLAEGRTPSAAAFPEKEYSFSECYVVTKDTLTECYELIRDRHDDYIICAMPDSAAVDAMFD